MVRRHVLLALVRVERFGDDYALIVRKDPELCRREELHALPVEGRRPAAPSIRDVHDNACLLPEELRDPFGRHSIGASAEVQRRVAVARELRPVLLVHVLKLRQGLEDDRHGYLIFPDGSHLLLKLRDLPDVRELVKKEPEMDREPQPVVRPFPVGQDVPAVRDGSECFPCRLFCPPEADKLTVLRDRLVQSGRFVMPDHGTSCVLKEGFRFFFPLS